MRVDQSSMDLGDLISKIKSLEIDLQPDFQRGQVWQESKKKRLIDTILRNWYVPAIHIVVNEELDREEILDGQQRLQAIISFVNDEFAVDGKIEPLDESIRSLHGTYYSQLPTRIKSRFRKFVISTVRLRDYKLEEPGELFFRLNQLSALTAAEQRNALIGTPRNQIKELVKKFEIEVSSVGLGFSNARMNYDDVILRLAVTLEQGGLDAKITANSLEVRYRKGSAFAPGIIGAISGALDSIAFLINRGKSSARLNKASFFSWGFFFIDCEFSDAHLGTHVFDDLFVSFDALRVGRIESLPVSAIRGVERLSLSERSIVNECVRIFDDRASSRVNDVSSVVLRDMCLNAALFVFAPEFMLHSLTLHRRISTLNATINELSRMPSDVSERALLESKLTRQWEICRAAR